MFTATLPRSAWCALLASALLIIARHPSYAEAPAASAPVAAKPAALPSVVGLAPMPGRVTLLGRYGEARVLVDGRLAGGGVRDVSGQVAFSVADPKVAAVEADGTVRARGDGKTAVVARFKGFETRVAVEVRGVAKGGPPRFLSDVIPVLTKAGCNAGACHGAAAGKGGFRLSLFAYDPLLDYDSLTRLGGARRLSRSQPGNSLILRKPAAVMPHGGGKRFGVGSPEYRLLRDWIVAGCPGPAADEPAVTRLEVVPAVRTLSRGQSQRFIVRALYADGSQRDATGQTLFTSSDETVTSVSPAGEATVLGPGEGAVVIRYRGLVTTARVISPFGPPRQVRAEGNKIDQLVFEKLGALGLEPSRRCTDAEFVRRVYLDAIGLPPTPDEVRAFLWSRDPQKREKLIDALLERPEYVDFWTMKWGDLLRNSRRSLSEKGMVALYRWIRQSVAENKPWDQLTRELLLARGSGFDYGPANYFRASRSPEDLAETTTQVFLGVRVQCARCHNHPFEKWRQQDYYNMAAFFARVSLKKGDAPEEQDVYLAATGEVKHPKTGQVVTPAALDAPAIPKDYRGDRRQALAEWLTAPDNPYFARAIVNRAWRHFMGRGLVEPVDDLRATNPPSNEALFDWLAQDFVQHRYDLKYLLRSIMRSQTYQISARPARGNERDGKYYSHFLVKRLGAEQLLDALTCATGVPEKFGGYPLGTHATQLPDTSVSSYFLDVFGRPPRQITCDCERTNEPNIAQALHLMNSASINDKLSSKNGHVAALLQAEMPVRQLVDALYLEAVARFPTPDESRRAAQALSGTANRQQAAEDLMWALVNSKEFVFNH